MPQRMRLGPTSGGSIDTVRALVQLDQTDFQDLELSAETRKAILRATNDGVLVDAQGGDVTLESATGDVLPGSSNPALGTSATPWPSVSTVETHTETIGATEHHYAGDYDGADVDARLDNALSAASGGDVIHLESGTYGSARTFSTPLRLVGTNYANKGPLINAAWTIDSPDSVVDGVRIVSSGSLDFNQSFCAYMNAINGGQQSVTVGGNFVRIVNITNADVTFESGTFAGIVDASTAVSVTDNGSNTTGDLG